MESVTRLKPCIYGRKSSESEDRQVLSIESQTDKAYELAKSLGVTIPKDDLITESKSAKEHNNRQGFKTMISRIEKGQINAIITWHADRLSRNAIDSAYLIDLMDRGRLIEIITPGQTYRNTPMDKFMFTLSCTQAKMENDKKGIDVQRGLEKCASMGFFPSMAPIGYVNDKYLPKGQKRIIKDPERYDLVRRMWDLMLTGQYSPARIRDIATYEWGLRTKNDKSLAKSAVYWMFSNSFYYGMFEYPQNTGKWRQGVHEPMITAEEFDRVQALLGKKGRPRPQKHSFDFTGLMTCGECGASITAEQRFKKLKNGDVHEYVYYHCTKRKNPKCSQKSVEVTELHKQILGEIRKLEIPKEFHDFAMKFVTKDQKNDVSTKKAINDSHQRALDSVERKISNLIDLKTANQISLEIFSKKHLEYLKEKASLEKHSPVKKSKDSELKEELEQFLTFAARTEKKFLKGEDGVRKSILSSLGSYQVLTDKILSIDIEKSLLPMKKLSTVVGSIKERFVPINNVEKQRLFEHACAQNSTVLPR